MIDRPKNYAELESRVLPPSVVAAIRRDQERVKPTPSPTQDWADKATEGMRPLVARLKALYAAWDNPVALAAFVGGEA